MLVWLPEHGYELTGNKSHNEAYRKPIIFENPSYCYCGLLKTNPSDAKCSICGDPLMWLVEKSVTEGKIDSGLKL